MKDRIKKLLTLANNEAATAGERDNALEMASALMMRHGIKADELGVEKPRAKVGDKATTINEWRKPLALAVGYLYGCQLMFVGDDIHFAGRPHNIDAAELTQAFLEEQIEHEYKTALPRGMSKGDRREYRRQFKVAATNRVRRRILKIVADQTSNAAPVNVTGCTALVVVNHCQQLDEEVDELFDSMKLRRARTGHRKALPLTEATLAGDAAGQRVKIHREINEK